MVMTTRAGLGKLRSLAAGLQGVATLLAVIPPRPTDPTTDDAEEFADRLAGALPAEGVHTLMGHSVASYLAARLANQVAAQGRIPPRLVLLEPPLTIDLLRQKSSELLFMPEVVYEQFVASLDAGVIASAPRGTPEFRAELMQTLLTHRSELEAILHSVEPSLLPHPPTVAFSIYAEWAGWNALCMQLTEVTYGGPSVSIEGLHSAELPAAVRAARFARLRISFPRIEVRETTLLHSDLLSEAVLRPYFAP